MEQRYVHILNLVKHISQLDSFEEQLIVGSFKPFNLKKGEFFLESGKINRHVAFLHKGLVRYFVYNDGNEATFEFTKEGEFVADYQSFNSKTPSQQNIQAIECPVPGTVRKYLINYLRSSINENYKYLHARIRRDIWLCTLIIE